MMMSLFSSFDPSSSNNLPLNWALIMTSILLIPLSLWIIPPQSFTYVNIIFKYINSEIKNNLSNKSQKIMIVFTSIFIVIISMNLMGLYPYNFTPTSHLSITLSLALPLWITLMLFGWSNKTTKMFTHLVPNGTPMALASFMVLIETISNLIRPITLSVRLAANMTAGHLLLTLLSNIPENSPNLFPTSLTLLILLLILEYAVAMIQSYVFITLTSLYLTEIN